MLPRGYHSDPLSGGHARIWPVVGRATRYSGGSVSYSAVLGDEHPLIRHGLRAIVEAHGGEVLGEAATFEQVVALSAGLAPDLVVCSERLGSQTATSRLDTLGSRAPDSRVLALGTRADVQSARRLIRAGALGYTTKTADVAEVGTACQSVALGEPFVPPGIVSKLLAEPDGTTSGLTEREVRVIGLMHDGHTNPSIAKALSVSIRSVESARARIRHKLGTVDRATTLAAAKSLGVLS